jgi:hypothetical protein
VTEFSTEAVFEATVSSSSLKSARQTVEDELGNMEVQVAAQVEKGGDSGGGNPARDRAMGRRNQSRQIDALTDIQASVSEQPTSEAILDEWETEHQLGETRNELLRDLADAQVEKGGDSGGGNPARDRAMGRRNQSRQIDALTDIQASVSEQPTGEAILDEWETEHQLDETRNELLRDLADAQEQQNYDQSARGARGGGGLGKLLGGAVGVLGLSALSGVAGAASKASDALTGLDISPEDIVSTVSLTAADVVSPATLSASSVIGAAATVGVAAVIASGASVAPADLVSGLATISAAHVIAEGASISAGDVINSPISIGVDDVVAVGATVSAAALIGSTAAVAVGDLVGDPPNITTEDVLAALGIGSAAAPGPETSPRGDGGGGFLEDLGVEELLGGLAAGGSAGLASKFLSGAGDVAGGAASAVAGFPATFAAQSARDSQKQPKDQQSWLDQLLGDAFEGVEIGGGMTPTGAAMISPPIRATGSGGDGQTTDRGRERGGETANVEFSPTYEVPVDDLRRQVGQDIKELQKQVGDLERALSSRR